MDELPESDRLPGCPHPREQMDLFGHNAAEQRLLQAYLSGKAHHAWIIGGTRGIGKATLAYRFARFVLKHPDPAEPACAGAKSLHVDPSDPVFRRVASEGHADLFVARRNYNSRTKRLQSEISAETMRDATHFFGRTAGEGGWRICIVDAADDMNRFSANALLKILEEPPPRALFLLVAHAPGRLLATIRSRCLHLGLGGLDPKHLSAVVERLSPPRELPPLDELAWLSRGSPGRALALVREKGWDTFQEFSALIAQSSASDPRRRIAFAERLGARGAEEQFFLFFEILSDWLSAQIRQRATSPEASQTITGSQWALRAMPPHSLGTWSEAWQQISHSLARTNALNLDRKHTVLQAIRTIEQTAAAFAR